MSFKIDGIRMRIEIADIDGDGIINEVESVASHRNSNITHLKNTTELGEVLEHQNQDNIDETGFSSSDFIANINEFQYSPLVVIDMLSTMRVISKEGRDVVRHIMRKSISVNAMGREHFIRAVSGQHQREINKGIGALTGNPTEKK